MVVEKIPKDCHTPAIRVNYCGGNIINKVVNLYIIHRTTLTQRLDQMLRFITQGQEVY